jgi:hypothetical protein
MIHKRVVRHMCMICLGRVDADVVIVDPAAPLL